MRFAFRCCLLASLLCPSAALALPAIWEPDYGDPIDALTGQDDQTAAVDLTFDFPFEGVGYQTVHVGTNGCLQLGGLGLDNDIDYDHWRYFEEFYADDDGADDPEPLVCPFAADLDLTSRGRIRFRDDGDRAVFTWDGVGTNLEELHLVTMQVQLHGDGRISFAYQRVLSGAGQSPLSSLDTGIVVGISRSLGDFPNPEDNPFDLSAGGISAGDTIYERWCYDVADSCGAGGMNLDWAGPANDEFDLEGLSLLFTPRVGGGFDVASFEGVPDPGPVQPGLWIGELGEPIPGLGGQDDAEVEFQLSFAFPFEGVGYTTVYAGTNGCLQLGGLGLDNDIDYDHWRYFEEFYADDDGDGDPEPTICPFNADLNLDTIGEVRLNDFGDHAVITWDEVGTYAQPTHALSFQVVLHDDGRILFTYFGMFDDEGEDFLSSIDAGIVVGISRSLGDFPTPEANPFDLSGAPFPAGDTVYQRWCYTLADSCGENGVDLGYAGETNDAFDLDFRSILFAPRAGGGFDVGKAPIVTLSVTGQGSVAVSDPPGISLFGVYPGTAVALSVQPSTGHFLQAISGCGGALVAPDAYLTEALLDDCSLSVSFMRNPPGEVALGAPTPALDAAEGDGGTRALEIPLTLSQPTAEAVVVSWTLAPVAGGTGDAALDFAGASSGQIEFAPGQTVASLVLQVVADDMVEPDEAFTIDFSIDSSLPGNAGANASLAAALEGGLPLVLRNDDSATLTLSDASLAENDPAGSMEFTWSLSHPVQGGFSLPYRTVDITATAGSDYVAVDDELVHDGDPASVYGFSVQVLDDDLPEPVETFGFELGPILCGFTPCPVVLEAGTGSIVSDELPASIFTSGFEGD